MTIRLNGMTWGHPRGYDPMVACSRIWRERTGVEIAWDKRSLQDFESFPVEELARAYDLIVIDHPHVGEVTAQDCLLPLESERRRAEYDALENGSVGGSFASYNWQGHQWAFPIDAAAQVQAYRPDLIDRPVERFEDAMALAERGRVLIPMRPPHSLMTYFSLAANLGTPVATGGSGELIAMDAGARVYDMIAGLMRHVPEDCYDMDPIAVSERMCEATGTFACAPLIYGYVSYGLEGFRPRALAFADMPAAGDRGPAGSTLGGTGIAVSAFSAHAAEARDFAYWIASGAVQRGPFAAAGGQPGHAEAWDDDGVNAAAGQFYRNTRRTLDGAWIRPRHRGYMAFQALASERLNAGLQSGEDARAVVADLNEMFARSCG
ncbi:extracellular solute-binding protein [Oricola thermophila]|uniref:Extracellular solute-binding protein n=1 Tax=Oricola thermophila TaxID=2742145 RepID=A0A6N1VDS4_9HYPH|nr:extracellular solute-binding protein [Oricola thermophila]QKV19080.1 extracellular solute-binding protein [Oricola thermophila]